MLLTVKNNTRSRIVLDSTIGFVGPTETREFNVNVTQLDSVRSKLESLRTSGAISYTTSTDSTPEGAIATVRFVQEHAGGLPTGDAGGAIVGRFPDKLEIAPSAVGTRHIAAASITVNKLNSSLLDPLPTQPGLRSLGTGAKQAAAGNHEHLPKFRFVSGADSVQDDDQLILCDTTTGHVTLRLPPEVRASFITVKHYRGIGNVYFGELFQLGVGECAQILGTGNEWILLMKWSPSSV
jgi:hypothetical protein